MLEIPSGAKAPASLWALMDGLKPVPFKASIFEAALLEAALWKAALLTAPIFKAALLQVGDSDLGSFEAASSRASLGAVLPLALVLIWARVKGTALGSPKGARASIQGPPG